jgi:transposase
MTLAYALLGEVEGAYLVADRAYDARPLADELRARGCTVVIPSTRTRALQRDFDRHLYRERALVENFFQRIKRLVAHRDALRETGTQLLGVPTAGRRARVVTVDPARTLNRERN